MRPSVRDGYAIVVCIVDSYTLDQLNYFSGVSLSGRGGLVTHLGVGTMGRSDNNIDVVVRTGHTEDNGDTDTEGQSEKVARGGSGLIWDLGVAIHAGLVVVVRTRRRASMGSVEEE